MLCPHCGGYVKDDANFCQACGNPIVKPSAEELAARAAALQAKKNDNTLSLPALCLMAGGALLLFISVFLPFFKIKIYGESISMNYLGNLTGDYRGLSTGTVGDGLFFLILAIIFLVLVVIHRFVKPLSLALIIYSGIMGLLALIMPLVSRSRMSSLSSIASAGVGFYFVIISALVLLAGCGLAIYQKIKAPIA